MILHRLVFPNGKVVRVYFENEDDKKELVDYIEYLKEYLSLIQP